MEAADERVARARRAWMVPARARAGSTVGGPACRAGRRTAEGAGWPARRARCAPAPCASVRRRDRSRAMTDASTWPPTRRIAGAARSPAARARAAFAAPARARRARPGATRPGVALISRRTELTAAHAPTRAPPARPVRLGAAAVPVRGSVIARPRGLAWTPTPASLTAGDATSRASAVRAVSPGAAGVRPAARSVTGSARTRGSTARTAASAGTCAASVRPVAAAPAPAPRSQRGPRLPWTREPPTPRPLSLSTVRDP